MQTEPRAHAEDARELWSVNDLAAKHSISRRHVYDLIERGALEARKLGRLTMIPEASRLAWLASLPRYQPQHSAAAA